VAVQATASYKITVCGIEELTEHCEARVSHVASQLDAMPPLHREGGSNIARNLLWITGPFVS